MGRTMSERGKDMDEALAVLHRVWSGEGLAGGDFRTGPPPASGDAVKLLIGGTSDAAVRRTVQYGRGWIAGGGGPDATKPMIAKVRDAWQDAGRAGHPRIAALAYFGLSAEEESRAALLSYYGFLGDWAVGVANSALRTPQSLRDAVEAYAEAGVDELILDPTVASVDEVDRLADAVL
jgi:alkanesulfonate monooxygenase SsuD/methylene tetrahydromethanopterin reductase-like flavin-dependent oxidoreductase (luciferase family)